MEVLHIPSLLTAQFHLHEGAELRPRYFETRACIGTMETMVSGGDYAMLGELG